MEKSSKRDTRRRVLLWPSRLWTLDRATSIRNITKSRSRRRSESFHPVFITTSSDTSNPFHTKPKFGFVSSFSSVFSRLSFSSVEGGRRGLKKGKIVLDFCEAGSLRDIIDVRRRGLSERQISLIMRSVMKGLSYLHESHIIHRDIKCGNILLSADGTPRIGSSFRLMFSFRSSLTFF